MKLAKMHTIFSVILVLIQNFKNVVCFLYGRPGFDSRLGTPMEISLLSSSSEDIRVGLNDCDLHV
jgi:hypothetical protein